MISYGLIRPAKLCALMHEELNGNPCASSRMNIETAYIGIVGNHAQALRLRVIRADSEQG